MVDWALEHGPGIFDLDQRDAAGLTLIMIAARNGECTFRPRPACVCETMAGEITNLANLKSIDLQCYSLESQRLDSLI